MRIGTFLSRSLVHCSIIQRNTSKGIQIYISIYLYSSYFIIFDKYIFLLQEKRAPGLALSLSRALSFISIHDLFNFKAVQKITLKELSQLKRLGQVYFIYLFLYSGLEFTLTFLTHHVFEYTSMQQGKMFFVIGMYINVTYHLLNVYHP